VCVLLSQQIRQKKRQVGKKCVSTHTPYSMILKPPIRGASPHEAPPAFPLLLLGDGVPQLLKQRRTVNESLHGEEVKKQEAGKSQEWGAYLYDALRLKLVSSAPFVTSEPRHLTSLLIRGCGSHRGSPYPQQASLFAAAGPCIRTSNNQGSDVG
jgi:hypothetical protein